MYMCPERANIPLQDLDRHALTVGAISGLHSQMEPSLGVISPVVDLKQHSKKAYQSTLASGSSEHAWLFSVAISWGNKMNFRLCANMSVFCSDSHK